MRLSIIVAVYNTSKYLRQCLDSVFAQNLSEDDFEVITVNDCSKDNSIDILNEYAGKHRNMYVVDKKVNEATFWSRVDGIVRAKGDYIGFVDSDDWIAPNMYQVMLQKAAESSADIVECGTIDVYEDGHTKVRDVRTEILYSSEDRMKYYSENPDMQLALYIRLLSRKVVDAFVKDMYPYFLERRSSYCGIRNEDDLLWPLLLSASNTLLYIEDSLCYHRKDVVGSTMDEIRKNPQKFIDACIYRVNAGFDVMSLMHNKDTMLEFVEYKQINVIFGLLGRLLETNLLTKADAYELMASSISRFGSMKKGHSLRNMLRFIHLRVKTYYCYKIKK